MMLFKYSATDHLKLKSSRMLFDAVPATFPVFGQALEKFYQGEKDERILSLLRTKS